MAQIQTHSQTFKAARMVVLNHPNGFYVVCSRAEYTREEDDKNTIAGIQVLGLEGEDHPDVEYIPIGMARLLFVDPYEVSDIIKDSLMMNDSIVRRKALIEPLEENAFVLEKGDVLYLRFGNDVGIAFEIVNIELPIGLPNQLNALRYELNRRDDLSYNDIKIDEITEDDIKEELFRRLNNGVEKGLIDEETSEKMKDFIEENGVSV
ncbi:hypothetical protein [Gallibacterium sp. ZY190522]